MKTPKKRVAHHMGALEDGASEEIIFKWVLEGAYKLSDKVHSGQEGREHVHSRQRELHFRSPRDRT